MSQGPLVAPAGGGVGVTPEHRSIAGPESISVGLPDLIVQPRPQMPAIATSEMSFQTLLVLMRLPSVDQLEPAHTPTCGRRTLSPHRTIRRTRPTRAPT